MCVFQICDVFHSCVLQIFEVHHTTTLLCSVFSVAFKWKF
jgi:hypothetical protein